MSEIKIFAHRGVSSKFPENTMIAFEAAVAVGADGIEFDVQLSKDGIPVIIHDYSLERTTTGTGFVCAHTCEKLKSLSAGAWFHADFENEEIPTLAEMFQWARSHSLLLNLELKGNVSDRERFLTAVLPLISQYELLDRVIISSFDHQLILLIQKTAPQVETAVLVEAALYEPGLYLSRIGTSGYHFRSHTLLEQEAQDLIKRGIHLRPYTVNDPVWMKVCMNWGCDGLFTDYPEEARLIRQKIRTNGNRI